MVKWYLHNLRQGLKTALFIPSTARFTASWHALVAIAVTILLSQVLIELSFTGKDGMLTYRWYTYQICLFSFTLIASYVSCSSMRQHRHIVGIAVAFLNSFYFIFLIHVLLYVQTPAWLYAKGTIGFINNITLIWAFLVMMRISSEHFSGQSFGKHVLAALALVGALHLLFSQNHFVRIYVKNYDPSQEEQTALDRLTSEELFDLQSGLRKTDIGRLTASRPGQTDIYALVLGSYGYQDVFMREVGYVSGRLEERLGIKNTIRLINNGKTVETTALANVTNLKFYLETLSEKFMQPKEDIVFIYLTSHGSKADGLSTELSYDFSQMSLSPQRLAQALKDSGIQNKIVFISACHSGVFIPHLKDDHTMIVTAAAEDRKSFGCSDENDLTDFARAYFQNALSQTTDLEKAFSIARQLIETSEKQKKIKTPSEPQIFIGEKIKDILRNYKAAALISVE